MKIGTRTNRLFSVVCSLSLFAPTIVLAQEQAPPQQAPAQGAEPAAPKIPNEQLDSLVAPIALYPDPLLAQVLAASTYPLEIVQLQQWMEAHKDLKGDALISAVEKENWDPSVQALAAIPDAVKLLGSDIKWTTDLGNAFLAQQSDVMSAVQRMRAKASEKGELKSNDKMKVETKKAEGQNVIVIEQSDPQVVYVPSYNPTVVYGPPPYPYPPVYYPPPGAVLAGAAISFGVGVAMGAAFHGGWGYSCGWGGHSSHVNVNVNNNYVRNSSVRSGQANVSNRSQWQHNPQHRGGAPYRDQATANRFGGGTTREDARAQRQQDRGGAGRQGGEARTGAGADRRGAERGGDRSGGAGSPGAERRADRGGGDRTAGAGERTAGGGERVGNRDVGGGDRGGRGGEALGGGSRGSFDGGQARSSSNRGSASMGERGGSRGSRSGGGGGGGGRGGGGRGGRR